MTAAQDEAHGAGALAPDCCNVAEPAQRDLTTNLAARGLL